MKSRIILAIILLMAAYFRLNNSDWDSGFHLHPDERFLTMVASDMKIPEFFVYGTLPLTLTKKLAVIFNQDNYNQLTILGRQLAGLADLLVVVLVFRSAGLLPAFFYAIAVLPIQLSHFFTVDPFLNLFMFASYYFASRRNFVNSAIFFGLALASKITAFFILPLIMVLIAYTYWKRSVQIGKCLLLFFLISYITLRLVNPNYFANSNWFNPLPNPAFINSLKQLSSYSNPDVWYPPAVQWINKTPVIFSLINMAFFGVGIPYFIVSLVGMIWIILNLKTQISKLFIIVCWVILFFIYQSTQFAQTMRYFIFLYPFLAIFAGIGMNKVMSYGLGVRRWIVLGMSIAMLLVWPLAFSLIYSRPHTRVAASQWIYKNIPENSLILGEYWDDSLPLPVANSAGKNFKTELLPVFDPDTPEKQRKINNLLNQADYYILSSNRGWGSIMTAPKKYPQMSKFYRDLFSGKTKYKKIKEFTSYPVFNDDWAEEAFTVYDHPKVMIFKKITSSINKK